MALPLRRSHGDPAELGCSLWPGQYVSQSSEGCLLSVLTACLAGRAAFLLKLPWPLERDPCISHLLSPGLALSPPPPTPELMGVCEVSFTVHIEVWPR